MINPLVVLCAAQNVKWNSHAGILRVLPVAERMETEVLPFFFPVFN